MSLTGVGLVRGAEVSAAPPPGPKPLIQIALLLDTSNSMDGLIDQAKTQLWRIVNTLAAAKRDNQTAELQVALFEYGKSSLPGKQGYLRLVLGLTTDLDKVSESLFALRTQGGEEYCGWVIREAVTRLEWSASSRDYKAIFIAGNESFAQGPVDFRESCKAAIAKGIMVNTIHCGSDSEGVQGKWNEGAALADGRYFCIDHNQAVVRIDAPQDKELIRLNAALNATYVAFGQAGAGGRARQEAQDAAAATAAPAVAAERVAAKASAQYRNSEWDLVDAVKDGKVKLSAIAEAELPKEMAALKPADREKYLADAARKRAEIQKDIAALHAAREKYVAEEMKRRGGSGKTTLDEAILGALREQAATRAFSGL